MSDLSTAFDAFLGLPGLRGFWPLNSFDESGNAYDISGHAQTLTYTGNPTYNINPQGTGYLDFDGTGDYLSHADAAHYDIIGTESYVAGAASGLTMGGWFYADNASAEYTLMGKDDRSAQRSFRIYRTTGTLVGVTIGTSGIASGLAPSGSWFFAVLSFSGTSVRVFLNGTFSGSVSPLSISNTTAPFRIGGDGAGTQLLPGGAALCFLCAEDIPDAQIIQLYEDSWPLFNTFSVAASETIALTEAVSRKLVSLVNQNQAVTLTEAQTVSMTRRTSQAETVTLTEVVTARMTRLTGQAETVTLSEAQSVRVGTSAVSSAETVTLTEAQTVRVATATVSQNQAVTLTEAQRVILASLISQAEPITVTESSTAVLLVSLASSAETITLSEAVTVTLAAFSVSASEAVTLTELILINTGTSLLVSVSEAVLLSEATGAAVWETVTIVIYDTLGLTDATEAPLFSITDTLGLTDEIIGTTIADTLTLTDEVTIGNVTVIVTDTLTFSEVLELDGPTVPPPATPATGGLDTDAIVLRLLYGNDRRNPIRTLDIAQLAPGAIRLMAGGFAPGAGERNQLWSGESIRFDGQDLLAESRKNSQLAVTYALKTGAAGSGYGSQAALSYFQRQITRFFTEAKLHQTQANQNHTVWLEYRWPDGLNDLPTPTFGQLSTYYEVYSANAPKWPDSLHNDIHDLSQGLIAGVIMEITGSPAPIGLKQRAANAGGAISLHDKGVLIASGASSKLHWPSYAGSGLTGNFTVTGWITLNATWGSGLKVAFDYFISASDRIRLNYDATNNYWVIHKTVGGIEYTDNSSVVVVASGDDVHLQLVQDATTLYLYVNGLLAASVAAPPTMDDGGLIALGCTGTGPIEGVDVILDGWRIMPDDITATQALALYEAELPIKQDGGQVGPPPYWWTKDGDGQVDNVEDTNRDNWGIIGGVGGDIESKLEIQVLPNVAHTRYWLGIKVQDAKINPAGYIYFDSANETADATASGGGYESETGTSVTFSNLNFSNDTEKIFNHYHMLARLSVTGGRTVTITPAYAFSQTGPYFSGKAVSYTGTGAFQLVSLGDLFVRDNTELFGTTPFFGPQITLAASVSFTANMDFMMLLPAPFVKVESDSSLTGGNKLIVENGQAWGMAASNATFYASFAYLGEPLTAIPNKYNYLFLAQGSTAGAFVITHIATLAAYVTPRYLLPGGMVA